MSDSVGVYLRISQDRDGSQKATQRQREDCEAWVARNEGEVAAVYEDVDASAFSLASKRPAFAKLLADVQDGVLDGVVAWKIDRIARRMADFVALDEACRTSGTWLVTLADGIDTRNPMGRTAAEIFVAMARMESENISVRQKRKRQELLRDGKFPGGPRVYGLTADKTAVIPEEVAVTREIVSRVFAGESLLSIAKDIDARGIRTARGNHWELTRLKGYLLSPSVAGALAQGGEIVRRDAWPAVISESEQEALAVILNRHHAYPRRAHYLLSGIAHCGRCGNTLTGWMPLGRTRYRCSPSGVQRKGCTATCLTEAPDEAVAQQVLYRLSKGLPTFEADEGKAEGLRRAIAEDERWLEQLSNDYYVYRSIVAGEYHTARRALAERLETARKALGAMLQQNASAGLAGEPIEALETHWAAWPIDVRRSLITSVCDDVVIFPAGRGRRWEPSKLAICWRI